jgi:hypothetical protein
MSRIRTQWWKTDYIGSSWKSNYHTTTTTTAPDQTAVRIWEYSYGNKQDERIDTQKTIEELKRYNSVAN